MSENYVIEVQDVSKCFKVYYDKGKSLKEKVIFRDRNKYEEHWVLNGVSFSVRSGETLGLIGRNGCGKSTTLKLLTRIIYPTKGTVQVRGRVSSLIELGAGFHPDMSGRENIFTNASIFGLSHEEIQERIDEIIDFSELWEFIDNPVRTYSSGMYMRLAFAVAINVNADILLIDEILAVGDINFQKKCFEKLKELKENGTTIVIVSHAMGQIEELCDRAIWLESGKLVEDGPARSVGKHYLESMEEERNSHKSPENTFGMLETPQFCYQGALRRGNQNAIITGLQINGREEDGTDNIVEIRNKQPIQVEIKFIIKKPISTINLIYGITRADGIYCHGNYKTIDLKTISLVDEQCEVTLQLENNLLTGVYWIDIELTDEASTVLDFIVMAARFKLINEDTTSWGIVEIPTKWNIQEKKECLQKNE